jgi:hypothetical protein
LADYDQLVTNFPFEPGDGLRKRLGLYACDETAWLDAWRWFGETIVKPTIILMMEERDDLPQGYPPSTRDRLRRYQERLESLAKAFPHWHCVHIDELLAECGTDAYVDRHHLTAYGLDLLRQRLLTWIDHRGILQQSCTGRPLRYQSWVVPERCDFVPLSDVYPRALASLYRSPLLIGNSGVTSRLAPVLASRGAEPHAAETCAAAPDDRPVDAVVYLHWAQFSHGDPRLQQVRQRFPQTFVEVSSHWNEAVLVGTDEFALRQEMRTLGREHHAALHGHPDTGFRRYVARVLLSRQRNHDGGGDAEWRQLWTGPAGPSQAHSRVDDLYTRWQRLETSTVFCSGIALR